MRRMSPRVVVATAAVCLTAAAAGAQIVVNDPAVTLRDQVIADLKRQLLDTLTQEADRIRQMAQRLAAVTSLQKYATADDVPEWRIHVFWGDEFLYATPYTAALNYGDGSGSAFEQVALPRVDPAAIVPAIGDADAEAAIRAQLATIDATDSAIVAATDQTGQLRYNGRRDHAAIDALETDAVDPSTDQSTTAVLDKLAGAGLIRARQQQARIQFLAATVEQLLVDNKRARDTEAATMNMQLERLRWGAQANGALLAGAADALRNWRQP